MTALLTDEAVKGAAVKNAATHFGDAFPEGVPIPEFLLELPVGDFTAGFNFARAHYEARLVEDAKVRAEMTAALEQARAWVRGDDEPKILMSRIEAALAAAKEIK